MRILGISCFFHDAAAALLQDGILIAAAEEERFSRTKHDLNFPHQAIQFCLEKAGISSHDLDYVVFFEKPFLKFERIFLVGLQTFPNSYKVFCESMKTWLSDKLWIKQTLEDKMGISPEKILFSEHHLSHAASAFFCSPYEEAAVLTADGVGEWATASYGVGRGNHLTLLKEIHFPHSVGLLYSTFTSYLGFEVNEGEYKVMGMASYGTPRHRDKIEKIIRIEPDGSFELNMDYFAYHYSAHRMFSDKFLRLFGPARNPNVPFFPEATGEAASKEDRYYADIAASIQAVTEDILLKMAHQAHRETGLKKLCMAGGVALNSVANTRILKETPFEEIYIQPSAGDGGAAVGAALYAHHMVLGKPRSFIMEHAYWGQDYKDSEIQNFLTESRIRYIAISKEEQLIGRVVDGLKQGKVIGWFQGRFEWGPRALGNRSILADPRNPAMKDLLNQKIKFRESFRPFAPSVLAERAEEFLDLPKPDQPHYPARFMLYVANVRQEKRRFIPAVTHVDGTGRLQTVQQETSSLYYRLIQEFGNATGIPMLLNTSFNLKGEPIVNTPKEAFASFNRSGMDALVLGNALIEKEP